MLGREQTIVFQEKSMLGNWFQYTALAAVMWVSVPATPALARKDYVSIDKLAINRMTVGKRVRFRGLILPAGGGYWYVVRSTRCAIRESIRINATFSERTKKVIIKAEELSRGRHGFYVEANIEARVAPAVTLEPNVRSLIVKSVSGLEIKQIDCLTRYL